MHTILSLGLGYLIGCINPAFFVGKRRNVNLKEEGTGNLGATNTFLVLGRKAGFFVAIFDILKSYLSARLARFLFPQLAAVSLIASLGTILGHCFPITLHFDGGRGLASFGGMIMACSLKFFLFIFVTGWTLMVLFDAGVAATVWGCIAFPVYVGWRNGIGPELLVAVLTSALLIYMHTDKIQMALELKGGDHIRQNIKEKLLRKNKEKPKVFLYFLGKLW